MKTTCWILAALLLEPLACVRATTMLLQAGDTPSASYQDTYIRSDTPTATNGTSPGLNVGTLAGTGANDMRGLLLFDLSTLPSNAVINSISLTLTTRTADTNSTNTTLTFQLMGVTQSFVASQASWQNATTSTVWTTAGGTMGSLLASADASTKAASGTSVLFDTSVNFVALAQSAFDNGQSLNLLLWIPTQEANTDRAFITFNANETSTASLRPLLTIDYTVVPEPGSASLAILGGLTLVCALRRRQS